MTDLTPLERLQVALEGLGGRDCVDLATGQVRLESIKGAPARLDALALALATPGLRALSLRVDPRRTPTLDVSHPTLEVLAVSLEKRPAAESFALSGALPGLMVLKLKQPGRCRLMTEPLTALVASAKATLRSVSLSAPVGWATLAALAPVLQGAPVVFSSHPDSWSGEFFLDFEVEALTPQRDAEWAHLLAVHQAGFAIDPLSCWWLVDRLERLAALGGALQRSTVFLPLQAPLHAFLLRQPAQLAGFDAVEMVHVLGAAGLSSAGLASLGTHLPRLQSLTLHNSHDLALDCLALQSPTLQHARFVHAHCLQTFQLDCPRLESLTLDCCDGETAEPHPDGPEDSVCRGNFIERLLRDLLDGAAAVRLPALKTLSLLHSRQFMAAGPVYEPLRVDVACTQGHPTLESLSLGRAAHLRSLTLRQLPALRSLALWDEDRAEGEPSWLESLDVSALDPACEQELFATGPRRAGLPLPPHRDDGE